MANASSRCAATIAYGFSSALLAGAMAFAPAVHATGEKVGRYTMSPADGGGFIRLDTETGQMSHCLRREGDWACREMGDSAGGLGVEIERLRAENQRLKGEIRQMEEILTGQGRGEKGSGPRSSKPELTLPSEKDIDEAMSYAQRMLRKFREKLKEIEGEKSGTPL